MIRDEQLPTVSDGGPPAVVALGLDQIDRIMRPRPPEPGFDPEQAHARDQLRRALFGRPSEPPRLGRYVIVRKLGEGAMGQVFEARDPQLERRIALKVLRPAPRIPAAAKAALIREAKALARLSHPNVVGVHDAGFAPYSSDGTESEVAFIAMELVEGPSLRRWLATRPRPASEIVRVFVQAGRGLAAAHRADLVHSDFKPHNVVLGEGERPRIIDFGLARHSRASSSPAGSPAYLSPECHQGAAADPRSDQYSFCVSMFEALAGRRPFEGSTMSELLHAKQARSDRALGHHAIPRRLWLVLDRGLDPDPEARHSSMDGLVDALERASKPRRGWWVVGSAVLAAAVASWSATPSDPPCARAAAEVDTIWNADMAERLRRVFEDSPVAGSAQTWANARRRLDAHAQRWAAQRRATCEAITRSDEPRARVHEQRACLDHQLIELSATLEALALGERTTIHHAIEAIEALHEPGQCGTGGVPQPVTGPVGQALAVASARLRAGDVARAREAAEEALRIAQARGSPPWVLGAILIDLGDLQVRTGDHALASQTLHDAAIYAEQAKDDLSAALVWTKQAFVHGTYRHDGAQALRAADMALAKLERLGPHPRVRGRALLARANTLTNEQRFEEAVADYEEAIELATTTGDSLLTAELHNSLGIVRDLQRRPEAAGSHYAAAAAIFEHELGAHHPSLAQVLTNWGAVLGQLDDLQAARAKQRRALAIFDGALGARHPSYASTLINAADIEDALGHVEAATTMLREGLEILNEHYGSDHPHVDLARRKLETILARQVDPVAAVAHH